MQDRKLMILRLFFMRQIKPAWSIWTSKQARVRSQYLLTKSLLQREREKPFQSRIFLPTFNVFSRLSWSSSSSFLPSNSLSLSEVLFLHHLCKHPIAKLRFKRQTRTQTQRNITRHSSTHDLLSSHTISTSWLLHFPLLVLVVVVLLLLALALLYQQIKATRFTRHRNHRTHTGFPLHLLLLLQLLLQKTPNIWRIDNSLRFHSQKTS